MKLQTNVPLNTNNNPLNYKSNIVLLGSCFAESIGNLFEYYKFQSIQNPFGILFHPKAIECLIDRSVHQKLYTEKDVFFYNERWHSFDAHSSLSHSSKNTLIENLNNAIEDTYKQLVNVTHLFITLGTSWVYKHTETDKVVANCHKVHQSAFKKEILSVSEITACLENCVSILEKVNHKVQIIFTVSPVRHLKDGFIENTQSKAHLVTALHQLLSQQAHSSGLHYFSSYEIVMDELRDYRFYKKDMVHPNNLAVNYIWELFSTTWISEKAQKTMKVVDTIQKGLLHKSFNPDSEAHKKFLLKLKEKQEKLKKLFPNMEF